MTTPIQEALTAVGASALIQKQIDPVLLEYQRRYAPVTRSIPTVKWGSTVYYFNNRTQNPLGGFVTDGGANQVSTSVYNQNQYTIRNMQIVGAVTGYAQAVTSTLIGNLRAREIEGAARGFYWDVENAVMWGNSGSTQFGPAPQFTGLDTIAAQFTGTAQNAIDWSTSNGGNFSLGALDQLIDLVETNVAEPVETSDWMFVVSPTANSRLSQLFTNQQRFVDEVEVATGLIVPSYRNIPIVKTSFLSARSSTMSAITTTPSTSAGTLAPATYNYQVSAIIQRFGETLPCAKVSATLGGQGQVVINFTAPAGFENSGPMTYKVFRAVGSAQPTLVGYVDAAVGKQSTNSNLLANQILDNGATLVPQYYNGSTTVQPSSYPQAYVNGNSFIKPLATGGENIYLMSRDPNFIVRPYVREMQPVDIYPTTASPDSLPYAMVGDTCLAVRAPKYLGRLANVIVNLSS